MQLLSNAFGNNQTIPTKYTCEGESVSPPLEIKDVPENTKTLALTMNDPDAPSGNFVHWLVWNVDPEMTEIKEGSPLANYVTGRTSTGKTEYMPPCPHHGESHHYVFKVYALNDVLDLQNGSNLDMLNEAMKGRIIEEAELVGVFQPQL